MFVAQAFFHHLDAALREHEDVFDVVGHAGDRLADGRHAFGLNAVLEHPHVVQVHGDLDPGVGQEGQVLLGERTHGVGGIEVNKPKTRC
jgi:hypothetical protein